MQDNILNVHCATVITAIKFVLIISYSIEMYVGNYEMVETNPLKPSSHYMYRQFNIQQLYVLPTPCIYVFCVDLRTNSDYFPIQQ